MIAVVAIKAVEITVRAKLRLDREGILSNVIKHCFWDNSQDEVIIPDRKRGMNSVQRALIHNAKGSRPSKRKVSDVMSKVIPYEFSYHMQFWNVDRASQ